MYIVPSYFDKDIHEDEDKDTDLYIEVNFLIMECKHIHETLFFVSNVYIVSAYTAKSTEFLLCFRNIPLSLPYNY